VRAFHALNHLMLAGKQMHISQSKHRTIAMPRPDAELEALQLTRDYTHSTAHRYGGKYQPTHIHPPSSVLYVSNIADSIPESELRHLFGQQCQQKNARIVVQMFVRHGHAQAFIRMPTLNDAVTALVNLHNAPLLGRQLRVSFANRDPEQIVDTDAPKPMYGYHDSENLYPHDMQIDRKFSNHADRPEQESHDRSEQINLTSSH